MYRAKAAPDSLTDNGLALDGILGSGPRASEDAFWFNLEGGYFGCADGGQSHCLLTFQGYQGPEQERSNAVQSFEIPPCPALKDCQLRHIHFSETFRSLSGLQISAKIEGKAVDYYMDDLEVSWYNNTCAAQANRSFKE